METPLQWTAWWPARTFFFLNLTLLTFLMAVNFYGLVRTANTVLEKAMYMAHHVSPISGLEITEKFSLSVE